MTHIPDEVVQAKRHLIQSYNWSFKSTGIDAIDDILSSIADAAESYHNTSQWKDEGHIDRIQKYADVAAAHLSAPCAVEVVELEFDTVCEYGLEYRVRTSIGTYSIHTDEDSASGRMVCYFHLTDDADCTVYGEEIYSGYGGDDEAKAAAQADFERRTLSCIVTKPFDVSAVRNPDWVHIAKMAGKYGVRYQTNAGFIEFLAAIRALSAEPAQGAPDFAKTIAYVIKEESLGGAACGWKSCSGCLETSEGQHCGDYPYSDLFKTHVGFGCSDCGGLGVVWEYYSKSCLDEMQRELKSAKPAQGDQSSRAALAQGGGE